jgi:hypothetical protein
MSNGWSRGTLARIKAIEPYDEHSAALKKEVVLFASYVAGNLSIFRIIANGDKIGEEVEKRGEKLMESENLRAVSADLYEKYPEAIVFILPTVFSVAAYIAIDERELEAAMMRSDVYREAATDGCLKDQDLSTMPAFSLAALGFVSLMEFFSHADKK